MVEIRQPEGEKPTIPDEPKPKFITKTDLTGKPVTVMNPRDLPKSGFEKGFEQPSYQCKEEELGTKAMVLELQKKHPENFYVMFASVAVKKGGKKTFWWKVIETDALKYKHYYRSQLTPGRPKSVNLLKDKDKFFHLEDGFCSINNIDWLREKFLEVGVESRYVNLFIVEFFTDRIFSEAELDNFRNYHGNIVKKFREMNQPKNIDTEYKKAMDSLGTNIRIISGRFGKRAGYAISRMDYLYFQVRLYYHNYCNGKIERQMWLDLSTEALDEIEVCLQVVMDGQQNLMRTVLRAQEDIMDMRPSLMQKKDIDKLAKQVEEAKKKKPIKKPKSGIDMG